MAPLSKIKSLIRGVERRLLPEKGLSISWVRKNQNSWIARTLPNKFAKFPETVDHVKFERTAAALNKTGPHPLWDGYRAAYSSDPSIPWSDMDMERLPDQVRTQPQMARFFSWLAENRNPDLIVEVGTAFGISAMYWAHGLRASGGRLLTFDPNPKWHKLAVDHLSVFGPKVSAVLGTFEDNIEVTAGDTPIDIAFVDAIHTQKFVSAQIELLIPRMKDGGLILMDDITFSDDMADCWSAWARDHRIKSSAAINGRVGLMEITQSA